MLPFFSLSLVPYFFTLPISLLPLFISRVSMSVLQMSFVLVFSGLGWSLVPFPGSSLVRSLEFSNVDLP
jgi:hypothetical protein